MFGHAFFLDNTLSIKHLPPPKPHPVWKKLREDLYRFIRDRGKLRHQEVVSGMVYVKAEELDPYPGAFLKDDLEEKITEECTTLAAGYRREGEESDAREALENIHIAQSEARTKENSFRRLIRTKELWEEMMCFAYTDNMRKKLTALL
jgi:hypothetical protein